MIVVTGATGQLGRAIVEYLVRRVPPAQVAVSVRDPQKAQELEALGVRVRRGDFAAPDGLVHAFEGASQLMLVSSNARAYGGDTLGQHRAAIEAARAVGAKRIVYTSHMAASASSAFAPMLDHAATEDMLGASGLPWTALRNGFYASSGVAQLGDAPRVGVLEVPQDGKVSWTAHADLAEAAAIVLTTQSGFAGPTPPLTGADALDLGEVAAMAGEITGRAIERRTIDDDELRRRLSERGVPARGAEVALGFFRASRAGEFQAINPALPRLLGRPPTSMKDVLRQRLVG
ncbi:MAG: NAD-dependent epimerase/dehydratase family protein [Myxococcales bacterium]|nr:MAG: NAD-dependent epimerase/dehydratase family protein [Myxococcales bacterium]